MSLFSKLIAPIFIITSILGSTMLEASSVPCGYTDATEVMAAYETEIDRELGTREQAIQFQNRFPYVIEKDNSDICEQDLSYRILHLLFGQSIDSAISEELFYLFHQPDSSTLELTEYTSAGSTIKTLYQSISVLLFSVFTVVVGWQTIRYVMVTQSTGDFMGNQQGNKKKAASVATISLLLILLMTPVGSLLFVQVIIFTMAVVAIKIANFFLSNFLHNIQMQTAEVQVSDRVIMNDSEAYSSGFIAGKLCEINTRQAILNEGFVDGGDYHSNGFWESVWDFFSSADLGNAMEFAATCNSYTDSFYVNGDAVLETMKSEIVHDDCDHNSFPSTVERDVNSENLKYGKNHSCFEINFSFPSEGNLDTVMSSDTAQSVKDDVMGNIAGGLSSSSDEYYQKFAFRNFYGEVIDPGLVNFVTDVSTNSDLTISEKNDMMIEEFNRRSYDLARKLRSEADYASLVLLENYDPATFANNAELVNAVYIQNLAAMNAALGGYIADNVDSEYESSFFYRNSFFAYNRYNRNIKKISEGISYTGLQDIRNLLSNEAAYNIMKGHCSLNSNRLENSFKMYERLDDDSDAVRVSDGLDANNFSCIDVGNFTDVAGTAAWNSIDPGTTEVKHFLEEDFPLFDDFVSDPSQENILEVYGQNIDEITSYAQTKLEDAESNKYVLAAYHYIVKKAFLSNMIKEMKDFTDHSVMKEVRLKGWAGLGSMMLEVASQQASAANMVSDASKTGAVFAPFEQTQGGISFVNKDAFLYNGNPVGRMESVDQILKIVTPMSVASGLTLGGTSTSTTYNEESIEFNMFQQFINWFIEFLFNTPFLYLKAGTGLDVDQTVVESLQDCSSSVDCYPTTVHPVNGLIMFGQSLFNSIIWVLLITTVIDFIASFDLIDTASGDKNSSKVGSGKALKLVAMALGGWIIKAIQIIASIISHAMSVMKPFFYLLLFAAILIGFIMPTIPYVMTLIVVVGWYITIFVVSIAFPLNLLLMSRIREDGQHELSFEMVWQKLGNVLIKPALITIGIIFSWVLVNVSIYYVNSTIFSVFSVNLGSGSGFLTQLATPMIIYFVFIMAIYFIIQHSFYIILKFADDVAGAVGLTQTGDEGIYSTLGIERLLAAQAVTDSFKNADSSINSKVSSKGDKMQGKIDALREKAARKQSGDNKPKADNMNV